MGAGARFRASPQVIAWRYAGTQRAGSQRDVAATKQDLAQTRADFQKALEERIVIKTDTRMEGGRWVTAADEICKKK